MDKIKIINNSGNWDFWSEEMISELEEGVLNYALGNEILLENDEFTIWSIHLPPGHTLPFHRHRNRYFWCTLSHGVARSWYDDGRVTERRYEFGDTEYFKHLNEGTQFIHNLQNIGDTLLIFITVEFKKNIHE